MRYTMLLGRYSPPHQGHFKLVRTLLADGKNVCIAIRDTPKSDTDPYSYEWRKTEFLLKFYAEMCDKKVKIIKVPDIDEVAYGRTPGWGIREIKLDKETEEISATKIRKETNKDSRI